MPEARGKKTADHARRGPEQGPTPRLTLRKRQRLHLQRDFRRVFDRRCSVADESLVVYVDRNGLDRSRLGIVASRRLGRAVARNRIKRLIREAFRLAQHELPAGLDVIVIPRRADRPTLAGYGAALACLVQEAERRLRAAERRV